MPAIKELTKLFWPSGMSSTLSWLDNISDLFTLFMSYSRYSSNSDVK